MGVVIERVNARAQTASCQAEETAAGPDIEETLASEALGLKHVLERLDGLCNLFVIEGSQEPLPVSAKLETLSAGDFRCVLSHARIAPLIARSPAHGTLM
jgi:hypothetical protein